MSDVHQTIVNDVITNKQKLCFIRLTFYNMLKSMIHVLLIV